MDNGIIGLGVGQFVASSVASDWFSAGAIWPRIRVRRKPRLPSLVGRHPRVRRALLAWQWRVGWTPRTATELSLAESYVRSAVRRVDS